MGSCPKGRRYGVVPYSGFGRSLSFGTLLTLVDVYVGVHIRNGRLYGSKNV